MDGEADLFSDHGDALVDRDECGGDHEEVIESQTSSWW